MADFVSPTMPLGLLIDENLSPNLKIALRATWRVLHTSDLGMSQSDLTIWEYAQMHRLVILTKDADFSDRVLGVNTAPPWVIRLMCGNLRARPMRSFLEEHWTNVETYLPASRLILVYPDRIEALS